MRARSLVALLLLAPATALMAGCVDCSGTGPPVTARDVGPGTDARAGALGFALTVRALDGPGGPPLPGAGVVVYWARDAPDAWHERADGRALVDASGNRVIVVADPGASPATPDARSTHRLRTDASGEAVARVPSNRVVGIVVAAPGFTEEWVPAYATGSLSAGDAIEVPLYRAALNATLDGTWGPGAASTAAATSSGTAWQPQALPFGEDDAARRAYVARMVSLRATLEWSNGPLATGDLAIGLGPDAEEPSVVADGAEQVMPGAHSEELAIEADELRAAGVLGAPEAFVGPATRTGFAAPFGLPFTLRLEAVFDTAAAAYAKCANDVQDRGSGLPGANVPLAPGVALVAVAGAALALAAWRRR